MYNFSKIIRNNSTNYLKFGKRCFKIPGPSDGSQGKNKGKKMRALQYTAKSKKLELVQIPIPAELGPNDVLVKVYYAGICGINVHIIDGNFPCKEDSPLIMGHEFSGTVEKVGSNITNCEVGDKIVVDPMSGCMVCEECRIGKPHYCKKGGLYTYFGFFRDGGWAEYCLVPETQVHKVPCSLTLKQAALCEPVSCVSNGWDILTPIHLGQSVLIIGSGLIGNLFASLLHLQGHKNVTISEPNQQRLQILEKLETGYELITSDILECRRKEYVEYLFDVIIECSGTAKAVEQAVTMLNYGGKMGIFGCSNPQKTVCLSPFKIFRKELSIYGLLINPFSFPKALGILEAMGERYANYDKLGIKVFPLHEYSDAIECLRQGSITKASFEIHKE